MKIGILTFHSVYNFGANLQAYSTVEFLKNNGVEPVVINWIPEDLEVRYDKTIPNIQADSHKQFRGKYLPCSEICRTERDILRVIENQQIKGVIVGSDAVLQHTPFLSRVCLTKKGIVINRKQGIDVSFPNPFWGSFIPLLKEKIPVVIMSASSQNTNYKFIRGSLRKKIQNSLGRFDFITVRDDWTRKMVNFLSGGRINPLVTPDPVFAYNQNVKRQLTNEEILKKFDLPEKYLLFSFSKNSIVSVEWLKSIESLAEKEGLKCVALTMPGGIMFDHPFAKKIELPLCPTEWYGLIRYSSGYIGELMHAIVVALHNSVPFFAFDAYGIISFKFFVKEESSKIYDLLAQAGFLDNRTSTLGKGYKIPSSSDVFAKISGFNKAKSKAFSINQQNDYNNMMQSIIDHFIL